MRQPRHFRGAPAEGLAKQFQGTPAEGLARQVRSAGLGVSWASIRGGRRLACAVGLFSLVLAWAVASPVQAASILVDVAADDQAANLNCSLREAITAANTNAAVDGCAAGSSGSPDTITFDPTSMTGAILRLQETLPAITDASGLLIDGTGRSVTVSGLSNPEDPNNPQHVHLMEVNSGAVLELKGLTLDEGFGFNGVSGGINNSGTLTVTNSTLSDHRAISGKGGAIHNAGTLNLNGSTLSGNSTTASEGGGGIFNSGTLTLTGSTVTGNSSDSGSQGAGVLNTGMMTVTSSIVSLNAVFIGKGGGFYNSGTLSITDSTVFDNRTGSPGGGETEVGGAGIFNTGTLTLRSSLMYGNVAGAAQGGALRQTSGTVTILNSTFWRNEAASGGGGALEVEGGTVRVYNSTFHNNRTAFGNGCNLRVTGGTLTLLNSIVAQPLNSVGVATNCEGTITDGGGNLADDATCGFSEVNGSKPGTPAGLDPNGPLSNGGPTQTIRLLPGSAAIDLGIASTCADPATVNNLDQRGVVRPLDGDGVEGARCDSGAFEAPMVAALTATPTPTVTGTATPTPTVAAGSTFTPTPTVAAGSTFTPTPSSTPTPGQGTLDGSLEAGQVTDLDLTAEGTLDWGLWGYATTSLDPEVQKSGGTSLGALVSHSNGNPLRNLGPFLDPERSSFQWNDGTPITSGTYSPGLQHNGADGTISPVGEGFSFQVPADRRQRQLVLYTMVHRGTARLTAELSDGSAAVYTLDIAEPVVTASCRILLNYAAGADGQNLNVKIVLTSDLSSNKVANVVVQAMTLVQGPLVEQVSGPDNRVLLLAVLFLAIGLLRKRLKRAAG